VNTENKKRKEMIDGREKTKENKINSLKEKFPISFLLLFMID